jgi:hypothetical protein
MSDQERIKAGGIESGVSAPQTRTPRKAREQEQRPTDAWTPASSLPVPQEKDGWTFRWIRTGLLDRGDNKNVSRRFREGWIAVKASEHPELQILNDMDSRFEDCIEQGGLLLCKMPTERVNQRRQYYQNLNTQQVEAVDEHFMRENNPRMSKFVDKKTRTSFRGD